MKGTLIPGHQVASGQAKDCPRPGGSVARQLPLMKEKGLDTSKLFPGTLNIALNCEKVEYPENYEFDFIIDWRSPEKPTHFRLHELIVTYNGKEYKGWSYRKIYPVGYVSIHPQPENVIEILSEKIDKILYGDTVDVKFC